MRLLFFQKFDRAEIRTKLVTNLTRLKNWGDPPAPDLNQEKKQTEDEKGASSNYLSDQSTQSPRGKNIHSCRSQSWSGGAHRKQGGGVEGKRTHDLGENKNWSCPFGMAASLMVTKKKTAERQRTRETKGRPWRAIKKAGRGGQGGGGEKSQEKKGKKTGGRRENGRS